MPSKKTITTYRNAIKTYGVDNQIRKALDVMANSVQSLESKKKEENSAVNSDIKDVKIDVDTDALPFY